MKKIRRLKRRLKQVGKAVKFTCVDKGFDLHWLGRRDYEVDCINDKYPVEARKISNGDAWEAGFWSGVCSTGRLFSDLAFPTEMQESAKTEIELHQFLMEKPWKKFSEDERDDCEKQSWKHAWEEFPCLDS